MILALVLAALLPASAPAANLLCETNAGMKPARLVVRAAGGHRLFVCAVEARKQHGKLDLTGFRVFMIGRNGRRMKKPLFESDLETRTYRAERAGQNLRVTELLWDGKANVPAYETTISCESGGCHVSRPPKCVFERPKAGSRRALEQIVEYQHGKGQGKVPPKTLIDSLAALAYSGDEDAQKIFQDRGPLALDGAASDAYFEHQANLEALRKAGCF